MKAFDAGDPVRKALARHGFKNSKELGGAKRMIDAAVGPNSTKIRLGSRARRLATAMGELVDGVHAAADAFAAPLVLELFARTLASNGREELNALVESWWRIHEQTRGIIEADLRGVVECFRRGAAAKIFAPSADEVSLEQVIHHGKILVLDLPVAESGGATLPALLAIKIALTRLMVGRYGALCAGEPLSRRGILVIQDEAHLLLSRPKSGTSSEGAALSVIREFGIVWILATQSLSLIATVLGSESQTAAFVAGARTRIFGTTGDRFTAVLSSELCGSSEGQAQPMACLWHRTPALEDAVSGSNGESQPLVRPEEFYALRTGQYVLRTSGGVCWSVDLRTSLPAPKTRQLGRGTK